MLNSLYIAQTGLSTSRVLIENVTNNVANENTPGYKKRVVDVSENGHIQENSTGRGSTTGSILRITSDYLYNNLMDEGTKEAYYNELSTLLGEVESVFQETETAGLSKTIDKYFKAIDDLNSNREDSVFINNYITQANALVVELKKVYSAIEDREANTLESVKLDVDSVNGILKEIASINYEMGNQSIPTNDLLDRRDLLEKQLAKYVNIEVIKGEPYELNISGQRAVWHDNVRTYSISEEYVAQKDKFVADDGTTSSLASGVGAIDADDKFVFTLNNVGTIELKFGDYVKDSQGNNLDINGDSIVDATDMIDGTNYIRALSVAINNDPYMNKLVTAYNGDYAKDINGNIITPDLATERYLVLEAKTAGVDGKFETTLEFQRANATGLQENIAFTSNDYQSKEASNEVYLQSIDQKTPLTSGIIQSKLENLTTNSGNNRYQDYKDLLNNFAFTLSDIHSAYATSTADGSYIYGQDAFDNVGTNIQNQKNMNLFSGSDIKTLQFNVLAVNNLTQMDLDYLVTFQHKSDFSFENGVQNPDSNNTMSFSKYFQELLVKVSGDKENNDFLLDSQKSITQSLSSSFNEIVKVDKDEEMLNLVKFQAAYEASAKMITIADQLLQTLLGIKR
ncbi:MAG: flagellar basal body rod C-terminal domain-containing protein [Arcobacteraceae bacterium]